VPPIDVAAVSALAGGDAVLLAELVAMFSAATPSRLAAIGAAIGQYRPAELQRAAHLLKGEASALHATEMADLCAQLEALGREGSVAGAPELLTLLEAAFARTQHALEQETLRTAGVSTA
jgi:HPt (histidine-containing phosphotransfer) domain-containing protein